MNRERFEQCFEVLAKIARAAISIAAHVFALVAAEFVSALIVKLLVVA